jgi:hypothetical protein
VISEYTSVSSQLFKFPKIIGSQYISFFGGKLEALYYPQPLLQDAYSGPHQVWNEQVDSIL